MDFATLIGVVAGVTLVFFSIFNGGGGSTFLEINSLLIVLGGTLSATFINFKIKDVLGVFTVVKNAFANQEVVYHQILEEMVNLSMIARREGILAIENAAEDLDDEFMKRGLLLSVDGLEPEMIRNIMESEVNSLEERHGRGQQIMKSMGTYAPAFGMIGTLIGLIKMLQTLDDPTQIGAGMAVALVTTFYGALLANLLFLPIAGKLETLSEAEVGQREMIIEGILSIQSGENPRVIEQKLNTYIPPKMRSDKSVLDKARDTEDVKAAA
ncbi:MAG: flagellar motor protein [Candidatus Marinimicrobia bacterium]|nr:flagellar motor protein [Candidatus Neomarinimicrobiota bacterium]MCF7880507.1 flagellar motor protein [Candidatus Neomarinimicrobiota bacterium]